MSERDERLAVQQVEGHILPAREGVIASITVTFRAAGVLETLFEKGVELSGAQEQILKSLDEIKAELQVVKIRASQH